MENQTSNTSENQVADLKDIGGQTKCPKCGATDISQSQTSGRLRCNFCRFEFEIVEDDELTINHPIAGLKGEDISKGLTDIDHEFDGVITLKCTSCGADVVIDTEDSASSRCHWCRNTLSINEQIPNGAIPDAVLPFSVKKDDAKSVIEKFVKKRRFFAHPKFVKEFTTENVMGVYFPYMTIDVNAHSRLTGQGEVLLRKYTVKQGKNRVTRYDADLYNVGRDFNILINDLTIESSKERLNQSNGDKTNNIINSVLPFDICNCVKFDANYMRGFTSEKRTVDIDHVRNMVHLQSRDIARFAANGTHNYNRGVKWVNESFDVIGQRWHAIYLPVWLYSYNENPGKKGSKTHYVAVNGRTEEVMGSVPVHIPKLFLTSLIIQIICFFAWLFTRNDESYINYVLLLGGFVYFIFMYERYRNTGARHRHEVDTETVMKDLIKHDQHIKTLRGLSNSKMKGANNKTVQGANTKGSVFDSALNIVKDNIFD